VAHIELDALHHGPNWVEATAEEFCAKVRAAMDAAPDGWVIDGNYDRKLRGLVTDAADTVGWLDVALAIILIRPWRRTSYRIRHNVELWNGNRESWGTALLGVGIAIVWAIRSYFRQRHEWHVRFASHPGFVRLRGGAAARGWLEHRRDAAELRPRLVRPWRVAVETSYGSAADVGSLSEECRAATD
jgi:hypothetical protein